MNGPFLNWDTASPIVKSLTKLRLTHSQKYTQYNNSVATLEYTAGPDLYGNNNTSHAMRNKGGIN